MFESDLSPVQAHISYLRKLVVERSYFPLTKEAPLTVSSIYHKQSLKKQELGHLRNLNSWPTPASVCGTALPCAGPAVCQGSRVQARAAGFMSPSLTSLPVPVTAWPRWVLAPADKIVMST